MNWARNVAATGRARRGLLLFAAVAVVVGFLNFVWFLAETSQTGAQGFERDGRFYLSNHGSITEVSRATYQWVTFHAATVFVTQPLAIAGGAYLAFRVGFPSMVRGSSDPRRKAHVEAVLNSGPVLGGGRCAGRIDSLRLSSPLIRVEVRQGGVLIDPFGMPAIGLEAAEIVGMVPDASRFGRYLQIVHGQTATPAVCLWLRPEDPIVLAIRSVAAAPPAALARSLSSASEPNAEPYSPEMKVMVIVGSVLALVFVLVAIGVVGPAGPFGELWLLGLVAIFAANIWIYFVRNRRRW